MFRSVHKKNSSRGFTTIEITVVIAMVSVLSLATLVATSGTKKKNRDSKRFSDINALNQALGIYNSIAGTFPIAQTATAISGADPISQALLQSQSIEKVPTDPAFPGYSYIYTSDAGGQSYQIQFCLETASVSGYSPGCTNVSKI
ncbi:MAG: hypothetical protein WAX38_03105 [Minisyncoccia bacterium]